MDINPLDPKWQEEDRKHELEWWTRELEWWVQQKKWKLKNNMTDSTDEAIATCKSNIKKFGGEVPNGY
jgi:hypothetical protein